MVLHSHLHGPPQSSTWSSTVIYMVLHSHLHGPPQSSTWSTTVIYMVLHSHLHGPPQSSTWSSTVIYMVLHSHLHGPPQSSTWSSSHLHAVKCEQRATHEVLHGLGSLQSLAGRDVHLNRVRHEAETHRTSTVTVTSEHAARVRRQSPANTPHKYSDSHQQTHARVR